MSLSLSDTFGEFIAECEEITQRISSGLQHLEHGEGQTSDILDSIYRDVHTLKGSANLYGFSQMGQLAHAMEAGLEPFRKKAIQFELGSLDVYFAGLNLLDLLLKKIEKDKIEPDLKEELAEMIPRLIDTTVARLSSTLEIKKNSIALPEDIDTEKQEFIHLKNQDADTRQRKNSDQNNPQIAGQTMKDTPDKPKDAASEIQSQSNIGADSPQTIRVQVARLDKLMNLIGEMVLVRNQVIQFSKRSDDSDFLKLSKRFDLVTSELQGEVMQTRMQPIGTMLDKFQRVVRDLNNELDKKIELVLVGTETEVDKSLLEAVKDPLTHIVRNACDHGIETPTDRRAQGKPEQGKITIRAFHEGGQIIIEISDDGKGLDRNKILDKALERNLISSADISKLSDQDIYAFIFAPGFSTAASVTTVSGRGVGMDVVRTNIEKIGGVVEVSTVANAGTVIRLRIPLTLAIVPAMVIRVGASRFAIPQVKLVELVRAYRNDSNHASSEDEGKNKIEILQGKPMFRMRGRLLPLVSLKEILGLKDDSDFRELNTKEQGEDQITNIVVLNGDGGHFGLMVDEIQDTTDIVVKPISKFLKNLMVYSGATIMGDGSVVLIFDVPGIAKKAELNIDKKNEHLAVDVDSDSTKNSDIQEFLLFKTAAPARHAIALCLVQRLEEFDRKRIEYAGQQPVIRYRNTILPLINLNDSLSYEKPATVCESDKVSVIVVQKFNKCFGIIVDEILDVITTTGVLDDTVKDRAGVLGGLLEANEVIVAVDPLEIIDTEYKKMRQRFYGSNSNPARSEDSSNLKFKDVHVLFAEDTVFFRKLVVASLEKAGIKVTVAGNGKEALNILESSAPGTFSILLSDIEMPHMTGLQLLQAVRASAKIKDIPAIALTTKHKESDQADGYRAGFNLYLEKFDSEKVISGIVKLLNLEAKAA